MSRDTLLNQTADIRERLNTLSKNPLVKLNPLANELQLILHDMLSLIEGRVGHED